MREGVSLCAARLLDTVYDLMFDLCVVSLFLCREFVVAAYASSRRGGRLHPCNRPCCARTAGAGHHIEAARELPIPSETQPAQQRSTAAHGAGQQDSRGLLPFGLTSCCYRTVQRGGRNYAVLHGRRRQRDSAARRADRRFRRAPALPIACGRVCWRSRRVSCDSPCGETDRRSSARGGRDARADSARPTAGRCARLAPAARVDSRRRAESPCPVWPCHRNCAAAASSRARHRIAGRS